MADGQNQTTNANCMWCRYGDHPAGADCPAHSAEPRFLQDILNVSTGWRLDGCKNEREALRRIEGMCRERLATIRMEAQ